MKTYKIDKRGFTLIELLAVIVVLAIVMVIAVQAVLPQLETARRNSFAIEANGAIDSAQSYFMNSYLNTGKNLLPYNDGDVKCITLANLRSSGISDLDGQYHGHVTVTKSGNIYLYSLTMTNNAYSVSGKGSKDGQNVNVTAGDVDTANSGITDTCSTGEEVGK